MSADSDRRAVKHALLSAAAVLAACAGPATTPFPERAHAIPGRIEAEHFDEGGEGVAFHDVDARNEGVPYRTGGADIEPREDASNKHGVGWTRAGEWLLYSVNVTRAGTYTIQMPVASNRAGGTFHIEFDGVDRTGPIRVPDTGGWGKLQVIRAEKVALKAGLQQMKVVMDSQGPSGSIGDIDLFLFVLG